MGYFNVGPMLDQLLNFGWYATYESNDVGPTLSQPSTLSQYPNMNQQIRTIKINKFHYKLSEICMFVLKY